MSNGSEHLNVGDVTGPRWAGGTRNPDAIDSSNAEKAWWDANRLGMLPPDQVAARRSDFRAGRASRDAEVAVLREQLAAAEARAVHAELEWAEADARTVLAEAVLEKVRDAWNANTGWVEFGESVRGILPVAPSSVLAAAKADAWDEGYAHAYKVGVQEGATGRVVEYVAPNPYRPERAAAARPGTEGSSD